LLPAVQETNKNQIGMGLAYGLTQFAQFSGFAAMFWFGGWLIDYYTNDDGTLGINPEYIFISIFALMFGAQHAGFAAAFGPDMGKCAAAAKRIFKI
jgi:hypothetical protein